MLKLSPNLVLNCSKKILIIAGSIKQNISSLNAKYNSLYHKVRNRKSISTSEITKSALLLEEYAGILQQLVIELEAATGEPIDKLLEAGYGDEYFEDKIIHHYATVHILGGILGLSDAEKEEKLSLLENFYDFHHDGEMDGKLATAIDDVKFDYNLGILKNNFDFEKFGLNEEKVTEELLYIRNKRGLYAASSIMNALALNCPENFFSYDFNPGKQAYSNGHYGYKSDKIYGYQTNSELFLIKDCEVDIAQVLPKDCTEIEQLAYDFTKAIVINTLHSLPDEYLKTINYGSSNSIVLTCDLNAMTGFDKLQEGRNYGGFYWPESTLYADYKGTIIINAEGSLRSKTLCAEDSVIHELGHKFDDMVESNMTALEKDSSSFNGFASEAVSNWDNYFEEYRYVLPDIVPGGYNSTFDNKVYEFFAESVVAYVKEPSQLKELCPDVYNAVEKMLYGDNVPLDADISWSERLNETINGPLDVSTDVI